MNIWFLFFISLNLFPVNLQQTSRSNSLTYEKLEDSRTYNGFVKNDYDFILTLGLSHVDSPLVVKNSGNSQQFETIIKGMQALHFGLGYYFSPKFMIGITGTYSQFNDNLNRKFRGLGDLNARIKYRVYNKERSAISIIPFLDIPSKAGIFQISGLPASYAVINGVKLSGISDETFGFGGLISYEYLFNWAQLIINLGYKSNKGALVQDNNGVKQIDYTKQIITGIGGYIPFSSKLGVNLEWLRKWSMPLFDISSQAQNELFAGIGFGLSEKLHSHIGVGLGNLLSSTDGNDYRISAGIKYVGHIKSKKRKPLKPVFVEELPMRIDNQDVCKLDAFFGDSDRAVIRFTKNGSELFKEGSLIRQVIDYVSLNQSYINSIKIEGHSSRKPLRNPKASKKQSKNYNQKLSEKRTKSVVEEFLSAGIRADLVSSTSYGQSKPIDFEMTKAAHNKNRRVEILVDTKESFPADCELLTRVITKEIPYSPPIKKVKVSKKNKSVNKVKVNKPKVVKKSDTKPKPIKKVVAKKVVPKIKPVIKEPIINEIIDEPVIQKKIIKKRQDDIRIIHTLGECLNHTYTLNYPPSEANSKPSNYNSIVKQIARTGNLSSVIIKAHSSKRPPEDKRFSLKKGIENNRKKALQRAESLKGSLTFKGISSQKITIENYGDSNPILDEKNEKAYRLNRRIEIKTICN